MFKTAIKKYIKNKLSNADIHIDGNRPWDIQVYDPRFFNKVLTQGSLGLGESYMDGWIDSKQLDESICRILSNKVEYSNSSCTMFLKTLGTLLLNKQSKARALIVGKKHYDLSNRLFQCMLDKRMTYSCAYWKNANNLDEAQEAKLDLVCRKIYLKPGMKVLDIGCGWGSFAKYAAEKYGAQVVGITISQQQLDLAKEMCKGLPIELRFQDYRDINETFDRVVSIGQMEHVGYKNYRNYMEIVHRSLKNDGLFLLHTIGNNEPIYVTDPWMDKYIFPNGLIPAISQLSKASENLFVMEDWHNFGADYDKTLMAWFHNFNNHWDELKSHYDERFYRMWKYYLLACAGAFRARDIQLWQAVYAKSGVPGGYVSVR
jgi:cyclopropane-fatty-acyl-phospholipid synthase